MRYLLSILTLVIFVVSPAVAQNWTLNAFLKHDRDLEGVAFSEDGRTLASMGADLVLHYWNPHTEKSQPQAEISAIDRWSIDASVVPEEPHTLPINTFDTIRQAVPFPGVENPSALLATGSSDQTIWLQGFPTLRPLFQIQERGKVWAVALSPDGRTLASGGDFAGIHLWDLTTISPIHGTIELKGILGASTARVEGLAFSPGGQTLAVATGRTDGEAIHLWDLRTEQRTETLIAVGVPIKKVAFSPDGQMIAAGASHYSNGHGRNVLLWKRGPLSPAKIPHAVELDGPTRVMQGQDNTFTVTVKNMYDRVLENVCVRINYSGIPINDAWTNSEGKAELTLHFMDPGQHDIEVSVLDRSTRTEVLTRLFPNYVEVIPIKTINEHGATVYHHLDGNETVLIKGVDFAYDVSGGIRSDVDPSKYAPDYTKFLPKYAGEHLTPAEPQVGNTCGIYSPMILLRYYGIEVSEATFRDVADISWAGGSGDTWFGGGNPIDAVIKYARDYIFSLDVTKTGAGVTQGEVKKGLNSLGVPVHHTTVKSNHVDTLRNYIRQSRPPIILERYTDIDYHYVVVAGYDTKKNMFLIADPNGFIHWRHWDKDTPMENMIFSGELLNWIPDPDNPEAIAIRPPLVTSWKLDYDPAKAKSWIPDTVIDSAIAWNSLVSAQHGTAEYTIFIPNEAPKYHDFESETLLVYKAGEVSYFPPEWNRTYWSWKRAFGAKVVDILWFAEIDIATATESFTGNQVTVDGTIGRGIPLEANPQKVFDDLFSGATSTINGIVGGVPVVGDIAKGVTKITKDIAKLVTSPAAIPFRGTVDGVLTVYYEPGSPAAPSVLYVVPSDPLTETSTETALLPNYPNPFNPETWIPYQLAKSAEVTLTIYAIDGKLVRILALGHQAAGIYHSRSRAAYWDGKNAQGERVASGLYFYTLTAGDFTATGKMLILK